jgi:hypothetical protein
VTAAAAASPALDPARWQPVLDGHADLFAPLDPGSAAALVAKADWDAASGAALEWRAAAGGMRASLRPWEGAARTDADLIFVGLRDALERLAETDAGERLSRLKDLVHGGEVLFFVMKTKCNLVNAGWEEFLESLGLAFMGACR